MGPRQPRRFEVDPRITIRLEFDTAIGLGEVLGQRQTNDPALDALGARLRGLDDQGDQATGQQDEPEDTPIDDDSLSEDRPNG